VRLLRGAEVPLGNIATPADAGDIRAAAQVQARQADTLPAYCRSCSVRFACHGECPKNRFIETPDGEPGLNYLCAG
jgi:uncharacterized protein